MLDVQFRTMDDQEGRKLTEWQRSYGVREDGEYYVPAAAADASEDKVMMRAAYEGISVLRYKSHSYVPLGWAKKEFPESEEIWSAFEKRMRELGIVYIK